MSHSREQSGWRDVDPTRRERDEIENALDQIDPLDRDRGVLVYYNGDAGDPAVREVPDQAGRRLVERQTGPSGASGASGSESPSKTRQGVGTILALAVLGYSVVIAQQILLGVLLGGFLYLAVARKGLGV